ncbi:MAG: hypothetical protein HYU78_11475 [Rhodocyclales bacterium]|nr:hypothetical protein [Rhodocyclales bacterium]
MARTDRTEWLQRLERWRRSGIDLRAFAAQERLSFRRMAWWRWRLTRDGLFTSSAGRATALVPISESLAFVELEPEPSAQLSPFEVVLGNGRIVRVPPAFDDGSLSRLLVVADGVA